ncbi:thioredoxin domain-containing protein [Janibacter sp. DB-40]|uniref:thioredoxin domain-containing protein n=1 Tax=Janibacter sp. DB-40 TaxID=3028808 RepID=UPI002406147E|nr:thioredoxin domain-containing protein [Janibacter sp. DB-40]
MANRLADSLSPYLRQHADNPVDWFEWGEDAFAEARRRDVPIFLSVGYAACHWCHVMAHECFEDETVAAALNQGWVSVKVDREERPDIDAVYMLATQAMTGQGGWPMTVLITPDGEPFFAGTYLPKPQLLQLLDAAGTAWREDRERLMASASSIAGQLAGIADPGPGSPVDEEQVALAVHSLRKTFDDARAGFGGAPKFPPSMTLEHLLRHHARTGDADALAMVERTCEAMARGGIHDQLAGGFARYSVDSEWVVPHFEKMLYDNALLLRAYTHWYRQTGSPLAARVAGSTADFLLRDLRTDEGGFASALDADTVVDGHSVEGATYVWTPAQLVEVLGEEDGARAAQLLEVTPEGTFEHGASTLQLLHDPHDPQWWEQVRARLLAARDERPQPALDGKVVTSWNGLAVAALADAGVTLQRPELVDAAATAARLVLDRHLVDGRLRRTSLAGRVGAAPAVLDDHGNLAGGLLALHRATGETAWLEHAATVIDLATHLFHDAEGWHDTPIDGEALITRPRGRTDNAEPSGVSAIAGALLTHSAVTGSAEHRSLAEEAVAAQSRIITHDPRFAGWALAQTEAMLDGPRQVAIVGEDEGGTGPLRAVAEASPAPGLVIVAGRPDAPGEPLLADRPLVDGRATAYVCRGFVCDRPVTDADALAGQLEG